MKPRITESTMPEALFDLLAEMIAPLEVVHTSISAESLDRHFQGVRPEQELQDVASEAKAGNNRGNNRGDTVLLHASFSAAADKSKPYCRAWWVRNRARVAPPPAHLSLL